MVKGELVITALSAPSPPQIGLPVSVTVWPALPGAVPLSRNHLYSSRTRVFQSGHRRSRGGELRNHS